MKVISWVVIGIGTLFVGTLSTPISSSALLEETGQVRVLAFWSTECPVAERYSLRLKSIQSHFEPRGVNFEAFFPQEGETEEGVTKVLIARGLKFNWALDPGGKRAQEFGVQRIPTVIVFDKSNEIAYFGAIDDAAREGVVTRPYLETALNDVLAGRRPVLTITEPTGCLVMPEVQEDVLPMVTYARDVKPLIDRMCGSCHREGGSAPFKLDNFPDARRWAPMIQEVLEQGKMPPVNPSIEDEMALTEVIAQWRESGRPGGVIGTPEPSQTKAFDSRLEVPTTIVLPARDRGLEVERSLKSDKSIPGGQFVVRSRIPHEIRGVDLLAYRDEKWLLVGRWRGGIIGTFSGIQADETITAKIQYTRGATLKWDRPVLSFSSTEQPENPVLLETVTPERVELKQQHLATEVRATFSLPDERDIQWFRPKLPVSLSDVSLYQVIDGKEVPVTFGDRLPVDWPRIFRQATPLRSGGQFILVGYSKKRLEQIQPLVDSNSVSLDLAIREN